MKNWNRISSSIIIQILLEINKFLKCWNLKNWVRKFCLTFFCNLYTYVLNNHHLSKLRPASDVIICFLLNYITVKLIFNIIFLYMLLGLLFICTISKKNLSYNNSFLQYFRRTEMLCKVVMCWSVRTQVFCITCKYSWNTVKDIWFLLKLWAVVNA